MLTAIRNTSLITMLTAIRNTMLPLKRRPCKRKRSIQKETSQ